MRTPVTLSACNPGTRLPALLVVILLLTACGTGAKNVPVPGDVADAAGEADMADGAEGRMDVVDVADGVDGVDGAEGTADVVDAVDAMDGLDGVDGVDAVDDAEGTDLSDISDLLDLSDGAMSDQSELPDLSDQGGSDELALSDSEGSDTPAELALADSEGSDVSDSSDTAPPIEKCPGYPETNDLFCGQPAPKKVAGLRLFFSLVGDADDESVCGEATWKLGNHVVLAGTTPDGISRGRLADAEIYYDMDGDTETEMYGDPNGMPAKNPFVIQLLDKEKNVVWEGRRREPLQVREFVLRALEEKTGLDMSAWMFPVVQMALAADFQAFTLVVPDLPDAVYLRFSRDLTAQEKTDGAACAPGPLVLPIEAEENADPVTEVLLADLAEVPLSTFTALAPDLEVKRIAGNADPANAVSFVILGDGYLAADKAKFDAHAQQVSDFLLGLEPYKSWTKHINVWRIWTPSKDPGASFDCGCKTFDSAASNCTSPHDGCVDAHRKLMYGSIFTIRALYKVNPFATEAPPLDTDRNLFPLFLFRIGMAMSLSDQDGVPVSGDAAFVLTNDEKQGAFGLFNASVTTAFEKVNTPNYLAEVATHEMGHAFGLLGDEYSSASDVCQLFELTPLFPNFSPVPAGNMLPPWTPWMTMAPPFPHTEDQGTADDVGCFIPGPGGGECKDAGGDYLLCRPQKTCKMKTNTGSFCVVCREQLIRRIVHHVDLVEGPLFSLADLGAGLWKIDASLAQADISAAWIVDGSMVWAGEPYQPYALDLATLMPGEHTVALSVKPAGDLVRIWTDEVVETISVTVNVP